MLNGKMMNDEDYFEKALFRDVYRYRAANRK